MGGHLGAQGLVGQSADDVGEGGDGAEQRHGPGVSEAQARGTLAVVDAREHDRLEGGGVGKARPPLAEGGQEAGVGGGPGAPQCVPVLGAEGLVQGEVAGVVHRGLDPQGPAFFQIGLGLR